MFSFSALWLSVVVAAGFPAASRASNSFTVIKCHDSSSVLRLACQSGEILVDSATYGSDPRAIPGLKGRQLCHGLTTGSVADCTPNANLTFYKNLCDGEKVCETNADDIQDNDKCFRNYNYVVIKYTCVGDTSVVITRQHCHRSIVPIECGLHEVILVESTFWGRSDSTTCSYKQSAARTSNTDCSGAGSLLKMREACEGRRCCYVGALDLVFGIPCGGTYFFVDMTYRCSLYVQACQDETVNLKCEGGKVIKILKGDFGRQDSTTCANVCNADVSNTDCSSEAETLLVLYNKCEALTECSFVASPDSGFTDKCPDTYKYLKVYYTCE